MRTILSGNTFISGTTNSSTDSFPISRFGTHAFQISAPQAGIIIYQAEDGNARIEVQFSAEMVWPKHRRPYGSVVRRTGF
jgi:hypothetical protein